MPTNNKNINTNVKCHINKCSKRAISEQSNLLVEPTLTCKEASQTIVDLSDDPTELTEEVCIYFFYLILILFTLF
jgi:hypothetical protein